MATILVIEDERAMRCIIATCLRKYGHVVVEARNGREGLECHALGTWAFDLVICDLILPEIGGMATIRTIHDRASDLPILVISGATKTMRYFASRDSCGGSAFLEKPFKLTNLVEAVERLLLTSARVE